MHLQVLQVLLLRVLHVLNLLLLLSITRRYEVRREASAKSVSLKILHIGVDYVVAAYITVDDVLDWLLGLMLRSNRVMMVHPTPGISKLRI